MINTMILMGNLGRDPEMRYTAQGKAVTEFTIAVNRGSGENRTTMWIKCVCWQKTAEFAAEYLRKGSRIIVEGSLDEDKWTDRETGRPMSKFKVNVRNITLTEKINRQEKMKLDEEDEEDDVNEELEALPF